jgi:D-sedoheptulose 7-phosphate isomerase
MKDTLKEIFYESADLKKKFIDDNCDILLKCAKVIVDALKKGGKVIFFGNGGSAADAQHLAAEFVNRFLADRPPLAALALTTDTSILTSVANDSDFQNIFKRQIEALGNENDIAFGISTSGNSINVIRALNAAKNIGMFTVALTGNTGGKMKDIADLTINVESENTPRIQEVHITIGHALCLLVEQT